MFKKAIIYFICILFFTITNSLFLHAASFDKKLDEIRYEINRDNLKESIRLLGKIKVNSKIERDQINLLFGDIYLKINQPQKAEEFYEKSFMTTNERIESLTFVGFAEVKLRQGQIDKAIDFAERSIAINSDFVRPRIILAIAKTRIGDKEEALNILNDLHSEQKDNVDVALAIAGYHSSFDDNEQAITILEDFLKIDPTNIKAMDELANLYWLTGNKTKALEYKFKVYKHYEFSRNNYQVKKIKKWILSIEPKFFDKAPKGRTLNRNQSQEYEKEQTIEYDERKKVPQYEEFDFAYNFTGSGFIVNEGKFVITNNHVIKGAKQIAVRNGLGTISKAKVAGISEDYDLAILELDKPYDKDFAIPAKDFVDPVEGVDVLSIGYPMTGFFGNDKPVITQGIISKVFDDKIAKFHPNSKLEGVFLTTTNINSGNSGGPIINLNGEVVGVSAAALNKLVVTLVTGNIPTSMGVAIKSNILKEVFEYERTVSTNKAKDKASIYQEMLPKIVFVVIEKDQ